MLSKYFTVVVIPQKTSKVTKFKIPVYFFTCGILFCCLLIASLSWVIYDYIHIKTQLVKTEQLQKNSEQYIHLITKYKDDIYEIGLDLEHLKEFNYKLRIMASLEEPTYQNTFTKKELAELKKLNQLAQNGILEIIESETSTLPSDSDLQQTKFNHLMNFFEAEQNIFTRIPSKWPTKGFLSSGFGIQFDPFANHLQQKTHGIQIATKPLNPVHAPADGLVVSAGTDTLFDNLIILDHGSGLVTKYGYVTQIKVENGDRVKRGQLIASVGNPEQTTGPTLHYEVNLNGIPLNPIQFINEE